jgi:hypothetical protein
MHIELTEMLRCPEPHREEFLVLSTGEMSGRMVLSGVVGCPVCHREYQVVEGAVEFDAAAETSSGAPRRPPRAASPPAGGGHPARDDAATLQALLDLGGPGGIVVLVGESARQAEGLAALMGGIHFVGVNAPADVEELPVLSLLRCAIGIPLKAAMVRGVVIGADAAAEPWLTEGHRVLLRGRRYVLESETVALPTGITRLAAGEGLAVGEKR